MSENIKGASSLANSAMGYVSTTVGLVSGLIGIAQFVQQQGQAVGDALWNSLYYIGFLGMLGTMLGGALSAGMSIYFERQASEDPLQLKAQGRWVFGAAMLGVLVGVALAIPTANENLQVLQMNPLEKLQSGRTAISPGVMKALGVLFLVWPFLFWLSQRHESRSNLSPSS